jgi:hypothetical protein
MRVSFPPRSEAVLKMYAEHTALVHTMVKEVKTSVASLRDADEGILNIELHCRGRYITNTLQSGVIGRYLTGSPRRTSLFGKGI